MSLHATDLLGALELAKRTGNYPEKLLIIGIQPKSLTMGTTLSDEVRRSLESLPDIIKASDAFLKKRPTLYS